MCGFWNKLSNKNASSAKVVDGNLIISLPDAINPVVWRMELGSVKASALEVRANDNNFLLALKTPKGDVHDIAPFDSRDKAVQALMNVSHALHHAEGKMQVSSGTMSTPAVSAPASSAGGVIKTIIVILAILALLYVLALFIVPSSSGPDTPGAPATSSAPSGEVIDGDQYLRGF